MYLESTEHMAERHGFDASGVAFRRNGGDIEARIAPNVLNHPVFGNPNTDINSSSFGNVH